jgi:uncharacterized protein YggU (UPF0235/DUF167 family)
MGSALAIKIVHQSTFDELTHISDDGTLILNLKSQPLSRDVNSSLISFLQKILKVSNNQIEIIAGEEGDEKLVAILDIDPDELHKRIMNYWQRL